MNPGSRRDCQRIPGYTLYAVKILARVAEELLCRRGEQLMKYRPQKKEDDHYMPNGEANSYTISSMATTADGVP